MPRPKKKKRSVLPYLIAALVVAAGAAVYLVSVLREQSELEKAEAAYYSAFGIDMPLNYSIHGIDVSSYQRTISWPSVKSMQVDDIQMGFTFIKATEGLNDVDRQFVNNWLNAKNAGMVCGAYHFFLATKSGAKQAHNFITTVSLHKGDLPPVLDVEQLYGVPPALMRQRVKECLDSLEHYYKVKPILYSYVEFYNQYLGKDFDDYPLWAAHYLEPEKPRIKRSWLFWQHNDACHVNGIVTPVDCNVFNGDSTDFRGILMP